MNRRWLTCFLVLNIVACTPSSKRTATPDGDKLNQVVEKFSTTAKRLDPYYATYYNIEEDLSQFGDYASPQFFARAKNMYQEAVAGIRTVRPEGLNAQELITYKLFKTDIENELKSFDYPSRYLSFNQMGNRLNSYLDDTSEALTSYPFDSVKHYRAFVKRSEGFLPYVDNQIALLKEGLSKKIVLGCVVAKNTPNSYKDGLEPVVEKHPFWRPILFMPKSFTSADRAELELEFKKMITERIQPGFKKFDDFFKNEYTPKCRQGFGLVGLPQAKTWYAHNIYQSTNLKLTAEQVHKTGLNEVSRIASEIEKIKKQLGFKGSYQAFLKSLLSDDKYFYKNANDMFAAFTKVNDEVKSKYHDYFSLVPKSEVRLVETSNPESAAGSYNVPTEMIPYGRFVVNTKNIRSVPIYGVTTLMLHEAIPGHHFQLALAYEMKDQLSDYRRKMFFSNAFVEGWALYAEYLGIEMGLFKDPLQRLGNLNDEMLRAVRLVVDTGIHHYGWSQKQTIAYMKRYLASDINDITREANRYSVLPGQALGYKIGQLHIIEMRKWAEKELGPQFDISGFHRAVLGEGTVSLEVLEGNVRNWVQTTKAKI